jgi:60 kDa SS-A/Ro ribonucleoprotein
LGTEGGTFYVKERPLTVKAATNVLACIAEDGKRTVDKIVEISDAGRAPKNDPAIFALALAAAAGNPDMKGVASADIRAYALAALPKVCRIPTHLFHFLTFVKNQRGFGRMLRRAVADWYARWTPDTLAYELVKYQSRDGWSNRDVLRQVHAAGPNSAAMRWAIGASLDERKVTRKLAGRTDTYAAVGTLPPVLAAFETAKTVDVPTLVGLIRTYNLTREMVPTSALAHRDVWEALLEKMPLGALLRNLGNLSKVGLLAPLSDAARSVGRRLVDQEALGKARIHPVGVLIALKTYAQGHGMKGGGEWTPVPSVVDALNEAFYLAFGAIEPTGKRTLYAVDVSGSMESACGGLPISCAEGAAAMALACAKTERDYYVMGFATEFKDLGLTPSMRLDDVLARTTRQNFGGTDCALPMQWALKRKVAVDVFCVITDSETWAGGQHPKQALRAYRDKMGIAAKQVVVGMTATDFTIADPADPLSLDVVGFDAATPQAISEFAR